MQERPYNPIDQDSRYFGKISKSGDWLPAMWVARSVEPGTGEGGDRRSDHRNDRYSDPTQKISARAFAEKSGTSAPRVIRFHESWERAADAGHVPHAAELVPGQDVQLPEDETGDLWRTFYTSNVALHVDDERKEALEAEAKSRGIGPSKVKDIASNPKALAAAIAADPIAYEAAASEVARKTAEDPKARRAFEEEADGHFQRSLKTAIKKAGGNADKGSSKLDELSDLVEPRQDVNRFVQAISTIQRHARFWNEAQKAEAALQLTGYKDSVSMLIDVLHGLSEDDLAALLGDAR